MLKLITKPRGDCLLRLHADNLIDKLAVFENQEIRNAANIELRGGARILIDVQLRDFVSTAGFRRKLIQDGRDHPAWSTPLSPRIDQNRFR